MFFLWLDKYLCSLDLHFLLADWGGMSFNLTRQRLYRFLAPAPQRRLASDLLRPAPRCFLTQWLRLVRLHSFISSLGRAEQFLVFQGQPRPYLASRSLWVQVDMPFEIDRSWLARDFFCFRAFRHLYSVLQTYNKFYFSYLYTNWPLGLLFPRWRMSVVGGPPQLTF